MFVFFTNSIWAHLLSSLVIIDIDDLYRRSCSRATHGVVGLTDARGRVACVAISSITSSSTLTEKRVLCLGSTCYSTGPLKETGALLPMAWGWNVDEQQGTRGFAKGGRRK